MKRLDDRYQLGRPIGRGGVGEVFEGWQDALERRVAIKLLRPELTRNTAAVARFVREARTTCRLSHPNVVTVFDVGETDDGRRFLVMELLQGQTLTDRLDHTGAFELSSALDIASQIVRGMAAGQGVGLVHRDLKPDNIFLLPSGHVKILDFGLATLLAPEAPTVDSLSPSSARQLPAPSNPTFSPEAELDTPPASLGDHTPPTESLSRSVLDGPPRVTTTPENPRLTRPGALMGTPRYMAPEQALRWKVDHRSDLYSFGCILFEMLTGEMPLPGPGPRDYMRQHVHRAPRRLDELSPDLPRPLVRIVSRLLEKDPDDRYPDWAALGEALRALRALPGGAQPGGVHQADPPEPPSEPYRFLQPFDAATRELFFGRDGDLARFRGAWEHEERPPMVLLSGASGVGKTSFLLARVVPHLQDTGHLALRVRGGARPFDLLEQMLLRSLARDSDADQIPRDRPLPELVDLLSDRTGKPMAIVLDQLEELFTTGTETDREDFQASMASLLAGGEVRARVVLSIREDYLGGLVRALHPLPLDEWSRTLALRPLEPDDVRAALAGPCSPAGRVAYTPFAYEDGLVDEIVDDLLSDAAAEVAPRIQAVGSRLWTMVKDRSEPLVRRQDYRQRLGGARGIIARVLDEAIEDLDPGDQGVAKELLRALSHLPGSATSRPAPESELLSSSRDRQRRQRVLRRLEDRWRVVQGYTDARWSDERSYRIAHEALIARIQQYGDEGSERNRARQLFHHGFNLWLQGGQRDTDLLPEQHFEEIQQHVEDMVLRSNDERTFFEDSRRRHNEGWERRYKEARSTRMRQRLLVTLYPASLMGLGFVLGQLPSDFSGIKRGYAYLVSRARVSGAALEGFDLSGLDLSQTRLRAARLSEAELQHTSLRGADLQQAVLRDVHAENAVFAESNLRQADFSGAHLDGADFTRADLRGTDLDEASMGGADFTAARFDLTTSWPEGGPPEGALGPSGRAEGLQAAGMDLGGLDLFQFHAPDANLVGADLQGTSLVEASLRGAHLDGARLADANLGRVELYEASLDGADLSEADLRQADLQLASLRDVDLTGADLAGAVLKGADLCGADLSGAIILAANFDESTACPNTVWPGSSAPEGVRLVVEVGLDDGTGSVSSDKALPRDP